MEGMENNNGVPPIEPVLKNETPAAVSDAVVNGNIIHCQVWYLTIRWSNISLFKSNGHYIYSNGQNGQYIYIYKNIYKNIYIYIRIYIYIYKNIDVLYIIYIYIYQKFYFKKDLWTWRRGSAPKRRMCFLK